MSKIPVDQRHEYPQDNTYWRSREQLAEAPEWKALAQREFANEASELIDPVSRRNFLQSMTASMGLAGLQACRRPVQQILPYTRTPEDVIPGVAQHYASSFSMGQHSFRSAGGVARRAPHQGRRQSRPLLKLRRH